MKKEGHIKQSEWLKLKGKVTCELFDLEGNLLEVKTYDNLVCNVSKNGFAGRLNNETSFTGVVNYGAIGTGTNSPAATDTTLQTEVARAIVETNSRASNVTTITFYFDPTTGNGNLKEFGAFIDGTAVVDTGTLFDRVNIDVTKTSLNSLRVTLQITVS